MASSPSPPSPGTSPVKLSDCIEDLLKFTLSTYAPPASLPRDYCSRLLQHDQPLPDSPAGGSGAGGVPAYPLYKHLARALDRSINSRTYSKAPESVSVSDASFPAGGSLEEEREKEWERAIAEKGSVLLDTLGSVEFELHVQEPYLTQLESGRKSVEGRCAAGAYNLFGPGSVLLFNKCLLMEVRDVRKYPSFSEMLRAEGLSTVLPGVESVEEGVQIYRRFYTEEKELSNGVLGISVSKPDRQPHACLADVLSGLGCEGVGGLVSMVHTAGTVADALPPPRSSLVASCMNPLRPDVKGCFLTDAARALDKHVNRSSEGWWGRLCGSASVKNSRALEVVNRLLNQCCWMNAHMLQPNEGVFEIRVREGYGARWSLDGSKFIGFLEPYTEDGYSRRWRN
ncbi:uncharacterized protein M6B38_200910 [Iris pallida]|uniref:ASCH domain-containing protein n=1 Tax=Iris pallida TaxID=29817 RepID=A0AAX6E9B1_IRIPA|nr:uncharacterized protein M6B38_200910 [Iris pallida]